MAEALGYHIGFKLEDERVIARTDGERRILARTLLEQGRRCGLFVFGAADNHLHAGVAASRREAGAFAHRVECSLRHRLALPVSFQPAHLKPIADQRHAYSVFRYCLRQEGHHGTSCDPFYDASNLPDLLGLRVVGAFTAHNVRTHLPRVRRAELQGLLAVAELESIEPRVELVAEAAAAALGLPDLDGEARAVVLARAAAVEVGERLATDAQLASWLGVGTRTIERLRRKTIDAVLVSAVGSQLRLRSAGRQVALSASAQSTG
jgi:hypothetical protein